MMNVLILAKVVVWTAAVALTLALRVQQDDLDLPLRASTGGSVVGQSYQEGDRVKNFQLVERIQGLGQRSQQHAIRYHWHDSLPHSNTANNDNYLTPSTTEPDPVDNALVIDNVSGGRREVAASSGPRAENRTRCFLNSSFCMEENIFHGGHGDIWRAHRIDETTGDVLPDELYVMKCMMVLGRRDILRCALREIYFGKLLRDRSSFPRFVTYFVIPETGEYWLVFRYEGISLQKMIYAVESQTSDTILLKPSNIWRRLRSTKSGSTSLKGIMFQLISNVAELHSLGIVHRDIKPSNILLNVELKPKLIIADFSSAFDTGLLQQEQYYPLHGPSIREETLAYAPPEVLLSAPAEAESATDAEVLASLAHHPSRPESFDIWSVGVVFLELLLGTSDIFNVDQRTASMIKHRLKKRGMHHPTLLKNALLLASYSDYCIYRHAEDGQVAEDVKPSSAKSRRKRKLDGSVLDFITTFSVDRSLLLPSTAPAASQMDGGDSAVTVLQQCSIREMAAAILRRDPLGMGFADRWGLDLLVRLLHFDPMARMNMSDALKHAYFQGAYVSLYDGSVFAMEAERNRYDELRAAEVPSSSSLLSTTLSGYQEQPDHPLSIFADEETLPLDEQNTFDHESDAKKYENFDDESDVSLFDELPIDLMIESMVFTCSKCQRKFKGNWHACRHHVLSRKHGRQCRYDAPEVISEWQDKTSILYLHNEYVLDLTFPQCLSDHFLLPNDPHSGWCDLRGRRKYIEDYHAVYFEDSFKFFGVFDGHLGSFAARFAAHEIFRRLQGKLSKHGDDCSHASDQDVLENYFTATSQRLDAVNGNSSSWQTLLEVIPIHSSIAMKNDEAVSVPAVLAAMREAFLETDAVLMAHDDQEQYEAVGGTTATIAMFFDNNEILIASVGDSRAVLCCQLLTTGEEGEAVHVLPVQLTLDHTPADWQEYSMVYQRGGFVDTSAKIPRVNGKLAVSRSLGDNAFGSILSAEPDLLLFKLSDVLPSTLPHVPPSSSKLQQANQCKSLIQTLSQHNSTVPALFLIVGSDGLWDVMTNAEASDLVCGFLQEVYSELHGDDGELDASVELFPSDTFQRVSKLLAHEALLRGSSDNIGVCVVDLFSKQLSARYDDTR